MPRVTDSGDPHRDLAGVLHDVSNALTVLLGWVGEARTPGASEEMVAYALTVIEERARVARDLARRAIGEVRLDEQRQIGAVIREVTGALRVEAARKGTRLVVSGCEATAMISGSLDLAQILTNLVLNAIAHAPSGTPVEVTVGVGAEYCTLVVSDEGPGIPASRQQSIFHGDSLRPGGTGVGLRHSRALARAAGGEVDFVKSTGDGQKGASFRVLWPRADAVAEPPSPTPRASDLEGWSILLVEDDDAVIQLLNATLQARGASVTVALNANQLSAALAEQAYRAVLIDLSPIAENPDRALADIRSRLPQAKILLITGNVDALPATFSDHNIELVRKPFDMGEVIRVLRSPLSI